MFFSINQNWNCGILKFRSNFSIDVTGGWHKIAQCLCTKKQGMNVLSMCHTHTTTTAMEMHEEERQKHNLFVGLTTIKYENDNHMRLNERQREMNVQVESVIMDEMIESLMRFRCTSHCRAVWFEYIWWLLQCMRLIWFSVETFAVSVVH